jgi:hypothetical protein
MMPSTADGTPAIIDHQVCVLYDTDSGEIRAVFESVTLEGAGPPPTADDIEANARRQSSALIREHSQRKWDEQRIAAIFADPDALRAPGPKRVDVASRSLVRADPVAD